MRSPLSRFHPLPRFYLLALLGCALAFSTSCAKKQESASKELLGAPILSYLPQNTNGFYVWNNNLEGATSFQSSIWGTGESKLLDQFKVSFPKMSNNSAGGVILEWLMNSTLMKSGKETPAQSADGVAFVASEGTISSLQMGIFLNSNASAKDFKPHLDELRKELRASGATLNDRSFGAAKGFSSKLGTDPSLPEHLSTIYVAASSTQLAVASSEVVLSDLFAGKKSNALDRLQKLPSFSLATSKIPPRPGQFTFGFFDLEALNPLLEGHLPELGPPGRAIPISKLGTRAIAISRQMPGDLSDTFVILTDPENSPAHAWMKTLVDSGGIDSLLLNPKTVVGSIGVSGSLLQSIRDALIGYAEPNQRKALQSQLQVLSDVKNLSLGVTSLPGGSLFPSAIILIQSQASDKVLSVIKQHIKLLVASSGMPLSGWQKKKILDREVEYVLSPLGIGLFLLETSKGVVIATSEQAVKESLEAIQSSKNSLAATMSEASRKLSSETHPHFLLYLDMPRLASLIETAQGNLAMFTGGSTTVQMDQLNSLKSMAGVLWSFEYDQGAFVLHSLYERAERANP